MDEIAHALVSTVFASVRVFGVDLQLVVLWLAFGMVFFTVRLGFLNVRGLPRALAVLTGRYADPDAPGEVSQFAALSTALSGTVGLGNIAGVAIAIAIGGPGAAFWMTLIGFFAMSLKYAEVLLAVRYRQRTNDGQVVGGPMWTLRNGLSAQGRPRLGRWLGGLYAGFALFAFVQIIQVNQSFSQIVQVTQLEATRTQQLAYGIGIAALSAVVLLGGVRLIGRITSRLVPVMCAFYVIGVAVILVTNASEVPGAIRLIVTSAFDGDAVSGGVLGVFVAGMRRAAYSSEAGIGAAAIAHSVAKTRYPASEGLLGLLEPFIDTVLICTATALALVVSGAWNSGADDIAMTSLAFGSVAPWFPILLAIAVFLFAFSTILATGFYGLQAWNYLVGKSAVRDRLFLTYFCCALPVGTVIDVTTAIDFIDSFFFLLAVPNLIGLYLMVGDVTEETRAFMSLPKPRRTGASPREPDGSAGSG